MKLYSDQDRFREDYKVAKIITIACCSMYLPLIALFIYQLCHGIVSLFSIAPIGMLGFILYFNIGLNKGNKEKKEVTAVDAENKEVKVSNLIIHDVAIGTKQLLIRLAVMTVFLGLSIMFFFVYNNKIPDNANLITATIISQEGGTMVEEIETDGMPKTEMVVKCVLNVEYELNDTVYKEKVSIYNVSKVYNNKIKIFVSPEGEFLDTFDEYSIYLYMFYTLLIACILTLLSMLFNLSMEFFVFIIFAVVGFGLTWLINLGFMGNVFFNPLSVFSLFFATTGLFGMLGGVLNKIFIK